MFPIKDTFQHNKKLSDIFARMAAIYRYQGPAQMFRARAYEKASQLIFNLSESVCRLAGDIHQLDELSGIGKSIGAKIQEFCAAGTIKEFQQLRKKVPEDLMELMHTDGIGPAMIRQIHDGFHVNTRSALKKLLQEHKNMPKGIGPKKMDLLFDSLQIKKNPIKRYPYAEILPMAEKFIKYIKQIPHTEEVLIAGSLRRRKETIGDIDIVVAASELHRKNVIDRILIYNDIRRVLVKGNSKISILIGNNPIQCDIRMIEMDSLGSALLYFTGSKEHNIQLRLIAKKRGWKINEYGLFDQKGKKIAGRTETEMYHGLGLCFIPPEKRWGRNEIIEALVDDRKINLAW